MAANSQWVLDDFSTSESDDDTNLNQNVNNWTLTGHDGISPDNSNVYENQQYRYNLQNNGQHIWANVSTQESQNINDNVNENITQTNDQNTNTDNYNYCRSSFNNWNMEQMPSLEPIPEFDLSQCHWDMGIYPNDYAQCSNSQLDNETSNAQCCNSQPNDSYDVEEEGETYIESNSPRPPPPVRTPPKLSKTKDQVPKPEISAPKTEFYHKSFDVVTRYNADIKRYYYDMMDIFKTVTLGKNFSHEYYDIVNNYVSSIVNGCVIGLLPKSKYFSIREYAINGRVFDKNVVMYDYGQYSMVAYALLDWAVHNPEKVC